jgi:starch phosphorylase
MEVALDCDLPTYSGGLGVLAGDTLRAAADLGLPVCGVTMLYRQGYFRQALDAKGRQSETPVAWSPAERLTPCAETATVQIEGRDVVLRAWRYDVRGEKGHVVPVYFLDASSSENSAYDRALTDQLYAGDERYRLCQETILGLGGVAFLKKLGLPPAETLDDVASSGGAPGIDVYHMNEGHAALLTLAVLRHRLGSEDVSRWTEADVGFVRERCVFTTHTPVPAGHDTFPVALAEQVLGARAAAALESLEVCPEERLNMSELAIRFSRFVNGVAKRHAEVSRQMFPKVKVEPITNGVHAVSWTADAMRALFDEHLAGWREDNSYLRYAAELPLAALRTAHVAAKAALFEAVERRTGTQLDTATFTLGFARRAAEYKRADLLFQDPATLKRIAAKHPLQIVFAGKAHPRDLGGKQLIEKVFAGAAALQSAGVKVVYLENYDMTLGRLITSGVDVWLNNPVKPLEASGTSGMKAAINGVPSLSTLDGWWVEGLVPDVVGWEIDDDAYAFGGGKQSGDDAKHRAHAAKSIYDTLETKILPLYYDRPDEFARIMRNAIFINGPYFNTHRMVLQYLTQAYTRRQD